jgi:hypothetical protein
MAEIVKLQVTERVKRTGDKENGTINSVNWGTVLCRHITAICYHVMAIYRYLPFFASTCWNKTIRALIVHLQSVGRPYGSFTARRKAIYVRVLLAPYSAASWLPRLGLGHSL